MAIKNIFVQNHEDNYVFIPACCYARNQFHVLACDYPPMFKPSEAKIDMPVTITDVPRLELDGSGKIEVTTGDAATPCIGVFRPSDKKAYFVFSVQQINGQNIGKGYENGEIRLTWPAKREKIYHASHLHLNTEIWEDMEADRAVFEAVAGSYEFSSDVTISTVL